MKAVLRGKVVAESDDIVEAAGYQYFPRSAVRMEWLEKAPRPSMQQVASRFGFWQEVEVG